MLKRTVYIDWSEDIRESGIYQKELPLKMLSGILLFHSHPKPSPMLLLVVFFALPWPHVCSRLIKSTTGNCKLRAHWPYSATTGIIRLTGFINCQALGKLNGLEHVFTPPCWTIWEKVFLRKKKSSKSFARLARFARKVLPDWPPAELQSLPPLIEALSNCITVHTMFSPMGKTYCIKLNPWYKFKMSLLIKD